jgi:exonuclease VII large subunit
MKKLLALSMLIPLAMVCSCQKQDAAAEQQLAQRKAELDAREKALDEREKALADRQKAIARLATRLPADLQMRAPKKDSSSNVQLSASIPPGLMPPTDNTDLKAGRERRMEELRALRQRRLDAIQKMRSSMGARGNPNASAPTDTSASTSASGSPDTGGSADTSAGGEATSPSPTPQ